MSFGNVYYKRTAATAKACYVCYKPTTTVLATINTTDFLYTCAVHLTDQGFATILGGSTDEEIAKVKEEWEEKQKRKGEEKEGKEKGEEEDKEDRNDKKSLLPVHERYALHRDFFAMREREHRKRRQAAQTRALAPLLPGAPRGGIVE
ncbi:hypothetical protein C0995_013075 [Termitomyces sp. Mi166|nr:hypothetical protein C0995_013075 [Termitomyces sp. Mi166\